MKYFLMLILLFCFFLSISFAKPPEVGIEEHLGSKIPMNLKFTNSNGDTLELGKAVNKPTILSFVYFHCPGICSPLLTNLSESINRVKLELGKDYQVISISFDHTEQYQTANKWKQNYIKNLKVPFKEIDWRFMTGDSSSIRALTDACGYYFKFDGKEDFIHTPCLIVISAEGKISRYILDKEFNQFDLKMALLEATQGISNPTISKFVQLCYKYDPESKSYVMNFNRIAGAIIFISIAAFFIFLVKKGRKNDIAIKN